MSVLGFFKNNNIDIVINIKKLSAKLGVLKGYVDEKKIGTCFISKNRIKDIEHPLNLKENLILIEYENKFILKKYFKHNKFQYKLKR